MLYAVNYADEKYSSQQKLNSKTAIEIGQVDAVIEYSPTKIKDYIIGHQEIFSYKRGAGLWLWKPYVIKKALEKINLGDWLFYCDSASEYIGSIKTLISFAQLQNVDYLFFELDLPAKEWTRRICFEKFYCNPDHCQVLASFILIQKTETNISIVEEWLKACEDINLLRPEPSENEYPVFKEHREDQSLLDIIVRTRGLRTFRDPSDNGRFTETGFYKTQYVDKFSFCTYPTTISHYRRFEPTYFKRRNIRREYLLKKCVYPWLYNFIKYCVEIPIVIKIKQSIARKGNNEIN